MTKQEDQTPSRGELVPARRVIEGELVEVKAKNTGLPASVRARQERAHVETLRILGQVVKAGGAIWLENEKRRTIEARIAGEIKKSELEIKGIEADREREAQGAQVAKETSIQKVETFENMIRDYIPEVLKLVGDVSAQTRAELVKQMIEKAPKL